MSLWVLIGPYVSCLVPAGTYRSFCVFKDSNGSLWVVISLYESLWILMGSYESLRVLMQL